MDNKIRKSLVAGNWKMNGDTQSLEMIKKISKLDFHNNCDVAICPPATLLMEAVRKTSESPLMIGAQDCHHLEKGAYTGEISAKMLQDLGVKIVILGHSERRLHCHETNQLIRRKATAAHKSNILPVICIGESETEKESGLTEAVVIEQIADSMPDTSNHLNTVIAYEPIWAIGTGKTPSLEEIYRVHTAIRNHVRKNNGEDIARQIRILYGGSVKSDNSKEIFEIADVDGALVGGASLNSEEFSSIVRSVA
ncbi:MAG: triose-phosphate isomerase [Pseudomonadota bacterium]|nr:triose-phosphate isomerase [Pseudomonadota bacterium]